ncbi:MAG: DEAD/DEAH box helicase [Proteobacteria bacterium]|nr:DEAD/DEAH box helicase [Pseudomonadota bacterium]
MALASFHPAVRRWFAACFDEPTEAQRRGWSSLRAGQHTLIAAPTGSGKTLAAFLSAIDELVRRGLEAELEVKTHVLYVSPLKALSNDVERNLQLPLAGIREALRELELPDVEITTMVRTGDTSSAQRTRSSKRPPHILVTTPESLYILLTSSSGRRALAGVRSVIVDEIHALVGNKRGSHLALSLERLAALCGRDVTRIGLSATQRPIAEVARFLVGQGPSGPRACNVVDLGHSRQLDLGIELPASPLEAVMAGEVWEELYDRLAGLIEEHRTTLVFVNTRRLAERLTRHLAERLGDDRVMAHHGSLSREQRLGAERRLKAGELSALVATASLELGIDVGSVDLVCQIGSTRSIATLLQRVGRSGHTLGALPKGRLFPLSRDELAECAALLASVRQGDLDRVCIPPGPTDILAQQLVATVAGHDENSNDARASRAWSEDELFALVRSSYPYRDTSREHFLAVVAMLVDGFDTTRGRRAAYLHHDKVNRVLRARRNARLTAITCGGAIPDTTDYQVVLEPQGTLIGTLNEDFVIESMQGDIFQLGNASWRILKVEKGQVRVHSAEGQPPTIPFWLGEAPGRSSELSQAVSELRARCAAELQRDGSDDEQSRRLQDWLCDRYRLAPDAAQQLAEYLSSAHAALGTLPTQAHVVVERFFDESGGMQLVVHAPMGSRLNRAWGLALRKRFCRSFNVELQAAATDDAIVLSLGPMHSFPLLDIKGFLNARTVRGVLVQALLDAPMFETRWRWNATRALAVPRRRGGRKTPPYLQRMLAGDLLAACFPDQVACLENVQGDREIPEHALVQQTILDCLTEAMDIEGLEAVVQGIRDATTSFSVRELSEPSPLAQEVLTARPYAFLDDAPLEERRTQAVIGRRALDVKHASELGALDPQAIARVKEEAWPRLESADELHDALVLTGLLNASEVEGYPAWLEQLSRAKRATMLRREGREPIWVAAERRAMLQVLLPEARAADPSVWLADGRSWSKQDALVELVRCRLEVSGPVTAQELSAQLGLERTGIEAALVRLEAQGYALRGRFRKPALARPLDPASLEWCERRLLARIHRYTLKQLRQEIEPVSGAAFMRFLFAWQHARAEEQVRGPEGLQAVLEQLEGYSLAAACWEAEVLPARIAAYESAWLDAASLQGRFVWARLPNRLRFERADGEDKAALAGRPRPVRSTPIAFLARERLAWWLHQGDANGAGGLSSQARTLLSCLQDRGALFFSELVTASGLLRTQAEDALAELVSMGRVTSDSFAGLRALLVPGHKRDSVRTARRRAHATAFDMQAAGRWSLLATQPGPEAVDSHEADEARAEACARLLLRRYGVVFRALLVREAMPPWRELVRALRRLEARGEIRGGRFVGSASGEQYALPEAVTLLRRLRREPPNPTLIAISAADPLNLVGIVPAGARVPALAANRILYRDGTPVGVREAGQVRLFEQTDRKEAWARTAALERLRLPSRRAAGRDSHPASATSS